ncbi:unnamed protein product [Fraxinus pennsylvanica]|uniref:Uncharacterized protein n=1 Tax=Fraxinus pennsylvanica TaxID=56036 RepID=A0AAD1YRR0_9LAMI|nr:unnamed protein product [Fraxinus pennsylvanica]
MQFLRSWAGIKLAVIRNQACCHHLFWKAQAGIKEVHFLPFNPVEKRNASPTLTLMETGIEAARALQIKLDNHKIIIDLCELKGDSRKKAHDIIDNFANRGLHSLGVARQTILKKTKERAGEPWEFVGLSSLFGPSRHDSAETIRKGRVKPSPVPDSWKLKEIFATGFGLGAVMTVVFFYLAFDADFFSNSFKVRSIRGNADELTAAIYLQVSIISQALIFVTRYRRWSFVEHPGVLLFSAFLIAQLLATIIAVYANWGFATIHDIGWGWAGVTWIFSVVTYFPLDTRKFIIRFALSGHAWDSMIQNKTAFTTKRTTGRAREKHSGLRTADRSAPVQ